MIRRCLPVLLLLLGACVGPKPQEAAGPLSVRGTVRGLERPQHARIAIYRVTPYGVVSRLHGADVQVDADGRFESEILTPDLYLFAMRAPGHPKEQATTAYRGKQRIGTSRQQKDCCIQRRLF